jgi:hypothetical protein
MNFTALEVLLIATQVILLPLIRYFLIQQKDDTIAETKSTIAKITNKAIHYIHENRDNIIKLEDNLKHKITLLKVRQDVLQARIADLEISLDKKNGFQCDILNNIEKYDSDIDTPI